MNPLQAWLNQTLAYALPNGVIELEAPWLLLLLPLPWLIWRLLAPYQYRIEALHVPFFSDLAKLSGQEPAPGAIVLRRGWLGGALACVIWALVLLAASRPQWVEPPLERIEAGRDLLLAIDLSLSMDEKDFLDPAGKRVERLVAAKRVLDDFVARRAGDRIGLIVFGSGAYVMTPFTTDHALVREQLASLQSGLAGEQTAIGDALGVGIKLFEERSTRHKLIVLLTDGNDTGSHITPAKAAEIAARSGITVHAVAIGDPQARGQDKVDVATLKTIAAATHGQFYLGADQRQLETIYGHIDALEKQEYKMRTHRAKRSLFQWPLGAALVLLFGWQILTCTMSFVVRKNEPA